MTDVKELIPEFFYLPEFLVNREGITVNHFQLVSEDLFLFYNCPKTKNSFCKL